MANRPEPRRAHTDLPPFLVGASWPMDQMAAVPPAPLKESDVHAWRMTVQDGTPQNDDSVLRSSFPVTPAVLEPQVNEPLLADMTYRITARKALSKSASRPHTAGASRGLCHRAFDNAPAGSLPNTPPTAKRSSGYFALAPAPRSESPRTPPSDGGSILSTAWTPSPPSSFKLSLRTVKVKVRTGGDVFAFRLPLNARLGDVCAALDARGACAGGCALHALRTAAWDGGFEPALPDDGALRANLRAASKAEGSLRLVAL